MTDDKRKHSRVPVVIEVLWDGATGKARARTTDLSEGGCFVDSVGHVAVGQILNLRLLSPSDEFITVDAEVIYEMPRFGFGVRFLNLSEDDKRRLKDLLKAGD